MLSVHNSLSKVLWLKESFVFDPFGPVEQNVFCSLLKMQQSTAVIAAGSQDKVLMAVDENIKP